MLREYINCFTLERLKVGECSDDVAKAAFINGLGDKDLIVSVYNKPLRDFDDTVNRVKIILLVNKAIPSYESEDRNRASKPDKTQKKVDQPGRRLDRP